MKKKMSLALAAALAVSMLSGCTKAIPLPEEMDQDKVASAAQAIVEQLLEEDYQAVVDAFRPDLKEQYGVTVQMIEDLMATVEDAGAFVGMGETLVLGGKNKEFDEPYAAYCEHEEDDVMYEMSLDVDLELLGLAAKKR